MNNPFSGHSDGQILATGIKVEDSGVMIKHEWILMDSGMDRGMDPVDGSCGSPILDDNRQVVGLFRYKQKNSQHCYAVSATELRAAEYEICEQEIEF